jgi:hypothetical protein
MLSCFRLPADRLLQSGNAIVSWIDINGLVLQSRDFFMHVFPRIDLFSQLDQSL